MARHRTYCAKHDRWHSAHVAAHERLGHCPRMPANPCRQWSAVKQALAKGPDQKARMNVFTRWLTKGSLRRRRKNQLIVAQSQAAISSRR